MISYPVLVSGAPVGVFETWFHLTTMPEVETTAPSTGEVSPGASGMFSVNLPVLVVRSPADVRPKFESWLLAELMFVFTEETSAFILVFEPLLVGASAA